jgi:hypothetical protein
MGTGLLAGDDALVTGTASGTASRLPISREQLRKDRNEDRPQG